MRTLWFAFKLVSLNHWEQLLKMRLILSLVVICFQISIFEPLGTIIFCRYIVKNGLWFAFKLVSLNHWEQSQNALFKFLMVVICFQISIFEPLGTITARRRSKCYRLWFAFKLVSLNHWEQFFAFSFAFHFRCDLLSN